MSQINVQSSSVVRPAAAAALKPAALPSAAAAAKPRLAWIDAIRWTVIAMVVLMHACVTYSGLGGWFYKEPGELGIGAQLAFPLYQTFAQAFFMGLLFFVSAAFVPASYDKKGFWRFLGERAFRLGIPSLVFMLVLDPLTNRIRELGTGGAVTWKAWLAGIPSHITSGSFLSASGPLWFAVALLLFCVVYALVRGAAGILGWKKAPAQALIPTPRGVHATAALLIIAIAVGSFLVRLVMPIGTSVMNMQLCYFTQYVVMFAVGLWAGRKGILNSIPRKTGMAWLKLSFAVGVPAWFLLLGFGGALSGKLDFFMGGLHWQSAAFSAWEAFFCVAVSIGLITLYRERMNARGRLAALFSDTSFSVYVFHAPILVAVSMALRPLHTFPLLKTGIAFTAAFLLSVCVAWVVRRIPGVRKVFA